MTGSSVGEIPISDVVLPYIAVRVAKRKRWDDEDEDAEGGEGARSKKHHGRKGRAKHKAVTAAVASADVVVEAKDVEMAEGQEDSAIVASAEVADTPEVIPTPADAAGAPAEASEPVLVLRRIQTVDVEGTQLIVFNAVG